MELSLSPPASRINVIGGTCPVCHNFRKRSLRYGEQERFAADFAPQSINASATKCGYCSIIHEAIRRFELSEENGLEQIICWIYARGPAESPPRTLSLEIYFNGLRPKLELEVYYRSFGRLLSLLPIMRILVALFLQGLASADDYLPVPAMASGVISHAERIFQPTEAISSDSLSWAQSHIDECLKNHSKCSNAVTSVLPSRVLSLESTSTGSIKVSLKETHNRRGVYACLSHRWGGSETGKATRTSYPAMLKDIAWNNIPRTFQDTIQFLLFLGIKYVWIDSYCIIQDDPLDWQEQAAQMANIYQNSYITLAATSSLNNESGCFWNSDTSFEKEFQVESENLVVRRKMKHWERLWASNSAAIFPLLSRAWVFQERLLAPRVVHFSQNELVWECAELGDCQCGGYFVTSNPKSRDWSNKDSWRSAVEIFTTLHLTIEQDRLPALFGFADFYAQSIRASLKTDYLAGLWKTSLHVDLLWRIDSSAQTLGTQSNQICCCFDGTYSSDGKWRCQYSYSAACSLPCLNQRRLCRYGKSDASLSYLHEFMGSCSGQGDGLTSIKELQKLYWRESSIRQTRKDPYLGPSWSWASSRSRVQYWYNIREGNHDCELGNVDVKYNDRRHMAGSIASGYLSISGHVTSAYLQYQYLPDPTKFGIKHHDIFNYGLKIREDQRLLDFYPDYMLCLEGEKWLPPDTKVFLLHIRSGAHLVLKEKSYFDLSREGRLAESSPLQTQATESSRMDSLKEYMRIGILRIPEDSTVRYARTYWQEGIKIV